MDLNINGALHTVDLEPDTPLLWVLRDTLGLTGTKYGCGIAQCGACTVMVDGVATRSCVTTIDALDGAKITTIEAMESDETGRKVVEAWVSLQVPQCGYCQSGQVMVATALLKENPALSADDIAAAMINFCRCGTYGAIKAAVDHAAKL